MEELFLKLLNMSITASWMILAVIILRLVLKNAPRFVHCILWGLVAIRLICPVSFESVLSMIPSTETVTLQNESKGSVVSYNVSTGINAVDDRVNQYLDEYVYESIVNDNSDVMLNNESVDVGINTSTNIDEAVNNEDNNDIMNIMSKVWISGVIILLVYSIVVYTRIYHKVSVSMRLRDNVYICDNIESPFILGVIRPRIYLPSSLNDKEINCVLAHEKAHIARLDYVWKPLGFVILSIYWFNPVIWMAYILLCRDIELACDERVIMYMNVDDKKEYSRTLLSCSVSHKMIAACPVAFGEVAVGRRVKTVLNYKKPAFWMLSMAIVACVIVAVCFLTNPKTYAKEGNNDITTENVADSNIDGSNNSEEATDEKIVYRYKHEYEGVDLWIMLEPQSKTYKMSMNFSIYDVVSVGMYEFVEDELVLTDILSIDKKYVFDVKDNTLEFNEGKSAKTLCFVVPKDSITMIPQTGGMTKEDLEQVYEAENYDIYEAIPDGAKYYVCEDGEAYNKVVEVFESYDVKFNSNVDSVDKDNIFDNGQEELIFMYEHQERNCMYSIYLNTKYNTFKMKYDIFSYCAASGYYIVEGGKIILTDFNELEKYVFEIVNGQLKFIADESTEMPLYAHDLNEKLNYIWIGRTSDETYDEEAFKTYSNDADYEIVRLINDGYVFRNNLLSEEELELQLYNFRESFREGIVDWN